MSRTHKDRKKKAPEATARQVKPKKQLSQHYLQFKRYGCTPEYDHCPSCGSLTDFQNGYLVCAECGWIDADEFIQIDKLIA